MIISPKLLMIILVGIVLSLGLLKLGIRGDQKPDNVSSTFNLAAMNTGYKSQATEIHVMQGSSNQLLLQLDMRYYKRAQFEIQAIADKSPNGWCMHLGDSPSNDGYGGDAGQFSHNAELQIIGDNGGMLVFGSEIPNANGESKNEMIIGEAAILKQKSKLIVNVVDGKIIWDAGGKKKGEKLSPQLFEFNGQPDLKHGKANDMQMFAAFNRAITNPQAGANCISGVRVTLFKQ